MTLYLQLREARRNAGLTQAGLARQAGCMQSAISMMERGNLSALSKETLSHIAGLLKVELPKDFTPPVLQPSVFPPSALFCPSPECPSNYPYRVGDDIFFLPTLHTTDGQRCPLCGEVLTSHCPGCNVPALPHAACCTQCGTSLITPPESCTDTWLLSHQSLAQTLTARGGRTSP